MPHRILVVDADLEALSSTESILDVAGYLATVTTSFAAAKKRMVLAPPDLLIADVRLGAHNGLHLAHRAKVWHPGMSTIITDAYPDPVLEDEAIRVGATYLPKPLDAPALVETIGRLLADRPAEPGTESMRQWSRKSAGVMAAFDDIPVTLADLSYGGLRLEIPSRKAEVLQRAGGRLTIPSVGSIPVRVVWGRNAGEGGRSWCGAEILNDVQQTKVRAWRRFVDSV
jgi:DNA-binding response OmpR family regulator